MVLTTFSIAVVLVATAFAFLFYRLASRVDPEARSADWLENFSLDSYAPMARLLDPKDFAHLERHAGYHRALGKRIRTERRKAFVGYLELMVIDFNQLLKFGRLMVVTSLVDRSDFDRALRRQQISFYLAVCSIRCKLLLAPLGLRVQGTELVASLGQIFRQVQELATIESSAG
jgi:hypothetical protein